MIATKHTSKPNVPWLHPSMKNCRGHLTMREVEILEWMALGKSTAEIAALLHISQETVKSHRSKMLNKLNCNNAVHLVAKAIKGGVI